MTQKFVSVKEKMTIVNILEEEGPKLSLNNNKRS